MHRQVAQHVRAQHHLPGHDRLHCWNHRSHVLFDEIAFRAQFDGTANVLRVGESGEHENALAGFKAVGARHLHVDEQHIRFLTCIGHHGGGPVMRSPHDLGGAGGREDRADGRADNRVIVNNRDLHRIFLSAVFGTDMNTRQPPLW